MVIALKRPDHHFNEGRETLPLIPEDELERFQRLRHKQDVQTIADMYWLNKNQVQHAFDNGKACDEVLNAMRDFYARANM